MLNHTLNKDIPSTNNLLEGFYKITLPVKLKKIFVTYKGAMNRIVLNNIRWMKRNGEYKICTNQYEIGQCPLHVLFLSTLVVC